MSNGLYSAVVLGITLLNPISLSVAGGIVANHNLQHRAVVEVRERNFRTACSTYKGMTTWERWNTPLGWQHGWCDDYLHRM